MSSSSLQAQPQQHDIDSITLTLPERENSSNSDSNSETQASKDIDADNDLEAGLKSAGDTDQRSLHDPAMRGRRESHKDGLTGQWRTPYTPEEDHTNKQYLTPFLLRLYTATLSLRYIKPVATYLSGPSRSTSSQPRLCSGRPFSYTDDYIEKPLVRYTRWTRYPLVLWGFLLAWFLGFTFLARAAWWNASVGGDVQWLDGTSTYWQRNDGCGLGALLSCHT